MKIYNLREDDWDAVIRLGCRVHGENYLDRRSMEKIFFKGLSRGLNCSYVAYDGKRGDALTGFRLTYAPGNWEIDKWCTPEKWEVPPEKVAYLKSITVAKEYRKHGLGTKLLNKSLETIRQMGGSAAVAHIWLQSPGNGAYKYFSKAGGQTIKVHANRWAEDVAIGNYICAVDGKDCRCNAAEMIIYLGETSNE